MLSNEILSSEVGGDHDGAAKGVGCTTAHEQGWDSVNINQFL
ncbi:hypothetical protein [Yersinia frederiksenii]|nr:hypothetical protein [Yersinia frederiksenii]